jgi:RNA polymerase sigma-70 factor (ECF subfamily)
MENESSETSQLLKRWHEGDREALDALLQRDLPWIERYVRSRLGPLLRAKAETQDLLQEALVEFLEYGPRFLIADRNHFRALLARIAENAIRAQHDRFTAERRSIQRERPLPRDSVVRLDPSLEPARSPSQEAQKEEWEALVRLALELLDAGERNLVLLRDWDGLSFGAIGERLGIAADAARMRYHRAILHLADRVERVRGGKLKELLADSPEPDGSPGPSRG